MPHPHIRIGAVNNQELYYASSPPNHGQHSAGARRSSTGKAEPQIRWRYHRTVITRNGKRRRRRRCAAVLHLQGARLLQQATGSRCLSQTKSFATARTGPLPHPQSIASVCPVHLASAFPSLSRVPVCRNPLRFSHRNAAAAAAAAVRRLRAQHVCCIKATSLPSLPHLSLPRPPSRYLLVSHPHRSTAPPALDSRLERKKRESQSVLWPVAVLCSPR